MNTTLDLAPAQSWVAEMQDLRDHYAGICTHVEHTGRVELQPCYEDAAAKYQLIDQTISDMVAEIKKAASAGTLTTKEQQNILDKHTTIIDIYLRVGGDSNA